jgi:hypothetical protein
MPTNAEQLELIKTQTLALMVTMTENPKPSYNIDGQAVSWTAYSKMLQDKVDWVDKQLASITPYEIHSQGFT